MDTHTQYRWFYTSNEVLVVGGKNAVQNDTLMKSIAKQDEERVILHTSHPGSPFCVPLAHPATLTQDDIDEAAIFCGCFSRAWKERKKKTTVHLFSSDHIHKQRGMKIGTWGVGGTVKEFEVELELVLEKQEGVWRAVPHGEGIVVRPGTIDKTKQLDKLRKALTDPKAKRDELLSALPPGGIRIIS